MEWINKLHSLCDAEFVAAASSSASSHRQPASNGQLADAEGMRPADASHTNVGASVDSSFSAVETRKRKRFVNGGYTDYPSKSGLSFIPLNSMHLDILRLVLPRCIHGGALSATSLPQEYIDRVQSISALSEVHKRKKFLRVLDELVRIELQNRVSLSLESDLVPFMPQDSVGWSADPSAHQTYLCALLLAEPLADPDRCISPSASSETRELQSLLDASRVALAEADRSMLSLRHSSHPASFETVTALVYLQSVLKRIETELVQIL